MQDSGREVRRIPEQLVAVRYCLAENSGREMVRRIPGQLVAVRYTPLAEVVEGIHTAVVDIDIAPGAVDIVGDTAEADIDHIAVDIALVEGIDQVGDVVGPAAADTGSGEGIVRMGGIVPAVEEGPHKLEHLEVDARHGVELPGEGSPGEEGLHVTVADIVPVAVGKDSQLRTGQHTIVTN